MTPDKCPVCGCVEFNDASQFCEFVCGCDDNGEGCENAERLAIERAAEIERLKAQLKAMADFFEDYTCLSECGQSDVEDQAERLIASARETLTATKPQETT